MNESVTLKLRRTKGVRLLADAFAHERSAGRERVVMDAGEGCLKKATIGAIEKPFWKWRRRLTGGRKQQKGWW